MRDALGLTYDVSFELSLYDRLRTGWFVCHVTSTHAKIDEALDASLRVLRSLPLQRVTPRELLRAKRTVLTRHESEMKVGLTPQPYLLAAPLAVLQILLVRTSQTASEQMLSRCVKNSWCKRHHLPGMMHTWPAHELIGQSAPV